MVVGDKAPALAGVEVERTGTVEQFAELRRRVPGAPAGDHERAARRPQQIDGRLDAGRIGQEAALSRRIEQLGQLQGRRDVLPQHVDGEVDVGRAGLAATFAERAGHRLVELTERQVWLPDGPGVAGQRPHEIGVDDVLQRSPVLLPAGRQTRDDEDGRPCDVGVGDARHRVGHAGPGGDQRHPEPAGQLGVGVGHVDGGPFVAHVDDPDPLPVEAHPDRHDVPATEPEDAVNAPGFEEMGDEGRRAVRRKRRGAAHGVKLSTP
jgi:hypothetical protein